MSCDEYPYFSSDRSGPAGFLGNPRTAHLEWVDSTANSLEGSFYGAFIQACGLGVEPDVKGVDTPFLVIPIVDLGLPTDRKC